MAGILRKLAVASAALAAIAGCATTGGGAKVELANSPCRAEPRYACPDATNCPADARVFRGAAKEAGSGRAYFLDYPCDLKPGEKVTFILNLHGAGSIGSWQRVYFPALDQADKYRLVIATPTALTDQPTRRWTGEADDKYLQGIVTQVTSEIGAKNVKAFWLAGHSQGGMTSRRIVCSDYFRDKVDGFVSLSGGRIGTPPALTANLAPLVAPAPGAAPQPAAAPPAPLTCDFSFIFAIGERESSSATAAKESEWATRFGCSPVHRREDVVDEQRGYVTASDQSRGPSWGTIARPGKANVYTFDKCKDGRIVADVVRLEKGHTEGLEPHITEEIIKMMVAAPGGKLAKGAG